MKTVTKTLFALLLLVFVAGCATDEYQPTKTGLQLQTFQKKEFETSKKIAFASVLSVFQDLGYIVDSADLNTGFITAKSPTQHSLGFAVNIMRDTSATAFIEELQTNNTTIRLNFVKDKEMSGAYGSKAVQDNPIEDPKFYENVFTKIQQAIFVRSAVQ